jgi:protein SCO1
MRAGWPARVFMAVVATGWFGVAAAQDLYRVPWHWEDDQGRAYELQSLYGTPTIMTMAYGACRRVCSTSLRMMEQLQALADARHVNLNFVVVGIEPHEDLPSDWAAYRAERRLTRPNWHFLSGDESSTRRLANRLGVHYWHYGEHTMHDLRIVLLSPEARLLRSIDAYDQSVETLLP